MRWSDTRNHVEELNAAARTIRTAAANGAVTAPARAAIRRVRGVLEAIAQESRNAVALGDPEDAVEALHVGAAAVEVAAEIKRLEGCWTDDDYHMRGGRR